VQQSHLRAGISQATKIKNLVPPPTTAEAVRRYFDGRIAVILDGGRTAGGTGSTIADCTIWPPRVLRAGPVAL